MKSQALIDYEGYKDLDKFCKRLSKKYDFSYKLKWDDRKVFAHLEFKKSFSMLWVDLRRGDGQYDLLKTKILERIERERVGEKMFFFKLRPELLQSNLVGIFDLGTNGKFLAYEDDKFFISEDLCLYSEDFVKKVPSEIYSMFSLHVI